MAGWVSTKASGPLSPHPDWFTSVLHKQLLGNAVLASDLGKSTDPSVKTNVAVHVWCAANAAIGAIAFSYVNMGTQSMI